MGGFERPKSHLERRKHSVPNRPSRQQRASSAKNSPVREIAPFFSIFYRGITKVDRSQSKMELHSAEQQHQQAAEKLEKFPSRTGGGGTAAMGGGCQGGQTTAEAAAAGIIERSSSSRVRIGRIYTRETGMTKFKEMLFFACKSRASNLIFLIKFFCHFYFRFFL